MTHWGEDDDDEDDEHRMIGSQVHGHHPSSPAESSIFNMGATLVASTGEQLDVR